MTELYRFVGIVRERKDGKRIRISAAYRTAKHFGWIEAFGKRADNSRPGGADTAWYDEGWPVRSQNVSGAPHRICTVKSRDGYPRQATHRFRLTRGASLRDVALVAVYTTGQWEWMELPDGTRKSREELANLAAALAA